MTGTLVPTYLESKVGVSGCLRRLGSHEWYSLQLRSTRDVVRIASIYGLLQDTHANDYFVSRAEETLAETPMEAERKNDQSVIIDIASLSVQHGLIIEDLRPTTP